MTAEIEQAIIDLNTIGGVAITKRTAEQATRYAEARQIIQQNYRIVFDECCSKDIDHINRRKLDLEAMVNTIKLCVCPVVPTEITPSNVTPVISSIYTNLVTLYGCKEQVEPAVSAMKSLRDRVKNISSLLLDLGNAYKDEAVATMLLPDNIDRIIIGHEEVLQMVKLRIEAHNSCQALISRLITIHLESPTGAIIVTGKQIGRAHV